MATLSKRRLLIEAFQAMGYEPVQLKNNKYIGYTGGDGETVYLIGKSAALRVMRWRSAVADSVSITGRRFYQALLIVGEHGAHGCYTSTEQARLDVQYEYDRMKSISR